MTWLSVFLNYLKSESGLQARIPLGQCVMSQIENAAEIGMEHNLGLT